MQHHSDGQPQKNPSRLRAALNGLRGGVAVALFAAMALSGAWITWRQYQVPRGTVTIGEDIVVRVEVAATTTTRERGLSGHAPLKRGTGMWFIFPVAERYTFWMKDMRFPLDMIWVRDGVIVDITADVPPPQPGQTQLPIYSPVEPADRVLEVSAGFAREHGLRLGMPVHEAP